MAHGYLAGESRAVWEARVSREPRRTIQSPDIRFEGDEKLNRLMQHIRLLTQEVAQLQRAAAGGEAGQVLVKRSAEDFDTEWQDP
jgi:hypothetical protein